MVSKFANGNPDKVSRSISFILEFGISFDEKLSAKSELLNHVSMYAWL